MEQPEAWAGAWSAQIGQRIRSIRTERGLSAQQVADRCAGLGYPIPRSTIANLEGGRRTAVPVQEVVILARALGVAPIQLLYVESAQTVDVTPKDEGRSGMEAIQWFSGLAPLRANDESYVDWLLAQQPANEPPGDGGDPYAAALSERRYRLNLERAALALRREAETLQVSITVSSLKADRPTQDGIGEVEAAELASLRAREQATREVLAASLHGIRRSLQRSHETPGSVPEEVRELMTALWPDDAP